MNDRTVRILLGGLLAVLLLAAEASANPVQNPGFESMDSGWTKTFGGSGYFGFSNSTSHSGSLAWLFGGTGSSLDSISQSIATIPGEIYTIEYWLVPTAWYSSWDSPRAFQVQWDGAVIAGSVLSNPPAVLDWHPAPSNYAKYSFTLPATSSSTLIEFQGQGNALGPAAVFYLDDISVTDTGTSVAIPEPTTLAIWSMLGGLGVAAARWRRRKA